MSATVTREHRAAAMKVVEPAGPNWLGKNWVESGKGPYSAVAQRIAEAFAARDAAAEQRGRSLERADALAWLRETPAHWTLGETPWSPIERAIAAGDHVGSAERAKDGMCDER